MTTTTMASIFHQVRNQILFSRASAKAERDLSSLYGMFLYVELGDPPGQDFMGPDQNATPLLYDSKFAYD